MQYNKSNFIIPFNSIFNIFILITSLIAFSFNSCIAQTNEVNKTFTFSLAKGAKTSAGIFTKDSILIRTLWSGIYYEAGRHSANWDGKDDEAQPVSPGTYIVKILSNNVKYTWEGVIGNTSTDLTGNNVLRSHHPINAIAICGNNLYYTTGYNEQGASTSKLMLSEPQKRFPLFGKGISANNVTTDGDNVYWSGNDAANPSSQFIFASKVAADTEITFDNGTPFKTKYGRIYVSSTDNYNNNAAVITGLTVQHKGPFLFAAHGKINTLNIINKKTGDLIQSVQFNAVGALTVDNDDNLWIAFLDENKPTIKKYKVTSAGKLLPTNMIISGLQSPVAMAVSCDNTKLFVADAKGSQQIKAFKNSTGVYLWALGKLNGYADDPTVTDDKFYFSDKRQILGSAIACLPDGSLWIEDPGNCRLLHFSKDLKIMNTVMYLNTSYSVSLDSNNPQRLFSDYLEFKINYDKPLNRNNKSWVLVKNWGANISPDIDDDFLRMHSLTTLSNGRCYTTFYNRIKKRWVIAELPKTGSIRFTNSTFDNDNIQLYPDGSLRKMTTMIPGKTVTWSIRPLLKFDENNDPIWAPEQILASIATVSTSDPLPRIGPNTLHSGDISPSRLIIVFGNNKSELHALNFRLAAIKIGSNKWQWRTATGTDPQYTGPFPPDGRYDNGNYVRYSGSVSLLAGRNIFWGYFGEFWKNSETNKWNHVYDNGLFVGQFGVTGIDSIVKAMEAPPMMAGNAMSAIVTKNISGKVYLYHNDESQHGGVHRWAISGLETIREQSIEVKL